MRSVLLLLLIACGLGATAQVSDVDRTFVDGFTYKTMGEWKPGMRFIVEPPSIHNLSVEIDLVPYKSKNLTTLRLMQSDFQGKIFTYVGTEVRKIDRCVEDDCNRTFLVFECEGKKYEYSSFFTMSAVKEFAEASVSGLAYYDEIEKAKEALTGKTIYLLDVPWHTNEHAKPVPLGKYLPVTVTSVGVGTQDGPVKISFKADGFEGEFYINTRISGINKATGEFGLEFLSAVSFDDPRNRFTDISKDFWHEIQHRKVKAGMTKTDCSLSWGKPDKITSTKSEDEEVETWMFGLSKSVTFKNGVVDSFTQ